jgi:AbrB family looped-hinge helix DNA binding protein
MERLTVDQDGKITIPSKITEKRGLRPGDELALVESAEGLLVYHGGVDETTLAWWKSLSHEQRLVATAEAHSYAGLTDEERDRIWNEAADSIEAEAESDEIDLPAE